MKVTLKIDMEEAIADIMLSQIDFTEKNLLPSGELRPGINVDFVGGVAAGQLLGLQVFLNDIKDQLPGLQFKELMGCIGQAMEDIKIWADLAKEGKNV